METVKSVKDLKTNVIYYVRKLNDYWAFIKTENNKRKEIYMSNEPRMIYLSDFNECVEYEGLKHFFESYYRFIVYEFDDRKDLKQFIFAINL